MRLSATKALLERRDVVVIGFRVRDLRSGAIGSLPENDAHLTVGMLIDSARFCVGWQVQYTRMARSKLFSVIAFRVRGRSDRHLPAESDDIATR